MLWTKGLHNFCLAIILLSLTNFTGGEMIFHDASWEMGISS